MSFDVQQPHGGKNGRELELEGFYDLRARGPVESHHVDALLHVAREVAEDERHGASGTAGETQLLSATPCSPKIAPPERTLSGRGGPLPLLTSGLHEKTRRPVQVRRCIICWFRRRRLASFRPPCYGPSVVMDDDGKFFALMRSIPVQN